MGERIQLANSVIASSAMPIGPPRLVSEAHVGSNEAIGGLVSPPAAMELVPEEEHVVLHRDPRSRVYMLSSTLSQEQYAMHQGAWHLSFDEGSGFLFDGASGEDIEPETYLVADLLKYQVFRAGTPGEEGYTVEMRHSETSRAVCLTELQQSRSLATIKVSARVGVAELPIEVAVLNWPAGGCRIMWSLPSLFRVMGFSQYNRQASLWTNHQWPKWLRLLDSMGVPSATHLLKSRPYSAAAVDFKMTDRFLPFHSTTTIGMICLAALWSGGARCAGGFATVADRGAATNFLKGVLVAMPDKAMVIHLVECPDLAVEWPCFAGCGFVGQVTFRWPEQTVDFSALEESARQGVSVAAQWLDIMVPACQPPTVSDLMLKVAERSGSSGMAKVIFRQLVLEIGSALDRRFADDAATPDAPGSIVGEATEEQNELTLQYDLAAYVAGARATVMREFNRRMVVSCALDESTVSGLELCNCAVVTPDGYGVWAPPQLRSVGLGLSAFQQSQDISRRPPDATRWPLLSVSIDQGPTGVCALAFAQRSLCVNVEEIYDLNHSVWNCEKQTIRDVGLQGWLLLMLVTVNVMDGPWSDNGRYQESLQAMRALLSSTRPSQCPLFLELLPMICQERGEPCDDPGVAERVWQDLQTDGPLVRKGFKCNLNRFFGFIDTSTKEIPVFWQKLFVLLFVSLEMNYLSGAKKASRIRMPAVSAERSADDPRVRSTNNQFNNDAQAVRAACANAYSIATLMHSEPANLMRWKIVLNCGKHNKAWQGKMNKSLRSTEDVIPFFQDQLNGSFRNTMEKILATTSSETDLADIGFTLPRSGCPSALTDGEVAYEDGMARLFAQYALMLVGNRWVRESWFLRGWPHRAVMLLGSKDNMDETFDLLKKDYENFTRLKDEFGEATRGAAAEVLARHPFNLVPCQQLIAIARQSNWELTDEFAEWLKTRFARISQTQLVEDGFNREKRGAKRSQNRNRREHLAFKSLIDSDLIGEVHRFKKPAENDAMVPRGAKLDERCFRPDSSCFSVQPQGLVTYQQKPNFYSPSVARLPVSNLDLDMLSEAVPLDMLHHLDSLWLGSFMRPEHDMIVRLRATASYPEGEWLVPLKHLSGTTTLFWPVIEVASISGHRCWRLAEGRGSTGVVLQAVWSLEQWEGLSVQWSAPVGLARRLRLCRSHIGQWSILACSSGEPEPIIRIAAKQAFWELKKTMLDQICRYASIEIEPGSSEFETLWAMLCHILPEMEQTDLLAVASKRLGGTSAPGDDCTLQEILLIDEAVACLDKAEESEVREEQKKTRAAEADRKVYEQKYRAQRVRVMAAAAAAPSSSGRKGARSKGVGRGSSSSRSSQPARLRLPEGDLQQAQIKHLVPPNCSIWRANQQGSWQGHCEPFKRVSASWHLWGHRFSAVRVLRLLWEQHLTLTGGSIPEDCPIEGLFSVQPAEAEAGAVVLEPAEG